MLLRVRSIPSHRSYKMVRHKIRRISRFEVTDLVFEPHNRFDSLDESLTSHNIQPLHLWASLAKRCHGFYHLGVVQRLVGVVGTPYLVRRSQGVVPFEHSGICGNRRRVVATREDDTDRFLWRRRWRRR